jgi:hypothetical protein
VSDAEVERASVELTTRGHAEVRTDEGATTEPSGRVSLRERTAQAAPIYDEK